MKITRQAQYWLSFGGASRRPTTASCTERSSKHKHLFYSYTCCELYIHVLYSIYSSPFQFYCCKMLEKSLSQSAELVLVHSLLPGNTGNKKLITQPSIKHMLYHQHTGIVDMSDPSQAVSSKASVATCTMLTLFSYMYILVYIRQCLYATCTDFFCNPLETRPLPRPCKEQDHIIIRV